jgi:hypothetical protein
MIQNPSKTINIKAPIQKVIEALNSLPQTLQKVNLSGYTLESKSDLIDQWVFTKTESLSLGARITIDLQTQPNDQTLMNIEISRVLGSFNQGYEVTNAMNHITNVTKGILWYLNPEESKEEMTKQTQVNGTTNDIMIVVYVIGGILMLGMML